LTLLNLSANIHQGGYKMTKILQFNSNKKQKQETQRIEEAKNSIFDFANRLGSELLDIVETYDTKGLMAMQSVLADFLAKIALCGEEAECSSVNYDEAILKFKARYYARMQELVDEIGGE